MSRLPTVTPTTVSAMREAVEDGGPMLVPMYLERIEKENPEIAKEIRKMAKKWPGDPISIALAATVVYEMLRAQAESDALRI